MITFDSDIIKQSQTMLNATEKELSIIFYSISPLSNRCTINFREWWLALIAATRRIEKTRVILSGWPKGNPQALATAQAAIQLAEAGAHVKIGNANVIIHPKTMCFDNKALLVGSHNATEAGFTRTRNISLTTTDQTDIGLFNDYFQNRWDSIK